MTPRSSGDDLADGGSGGRPLRTLHLCNTASRRGAEQSTVDLVGALVRNGLDSRVVALQPGGGPPLDLPILGDHGRSPAALRRLRSLAQDHDVVVAHGSATLLATYLATRGTGIPYLYRMIGDPQYWGHVPLRSLRVSRPLRAAAQVVPLWEGAATSAQRLHGLPADRCTVIINGRDHRRFRPPTAEERSAARRQWGLPDDRPVVGFLGALRSEKHPLRAVDAVALLPGVHLAMAGGGDLDDAVRARAGVDCTVLGPVDDPQRFLWSLDALVLTSETEGLPGVVIEAGLCGVPSVVADVGGAADLVDDRTGRVVAATSEPAAYAAALRDCLADRDRLGAAARNRSLERFTVDDAATRWISLFERVLGSPSPRG